jgi:HlyD family secretion protein
MLRMRTSQTTTLAAIALAFIIAGTVGAAYWQRTKPSSTASNIATASGRIEVERVDISTKLAGRLAEITVREGDFVERGTAHTGGYWPG